MMRRNHIRLFCLFLAVYLSILKCGFSCAQSRQQIDSLNHIPFEQKIKNPKSLLPTYLTFAEKAKQTGYTLGEMEAYENISLLYYYLGKYDLELEYALRSIKGFLELNKLEKVARFYGELGYRMKRHDIKKAEFYMLTGMQMAEKYKFQTPLMGIYDNYGVLKELQNQYDSAFYYYNKGLKLKRKNNDIPGLPYSLNNLGGLMIIQKNYGEANQYLTEALEIREKIGDSLGMCESNLILADLNLIQYKYAEAFDNLNFVIAYTSKHSISNLLSNAYQKRAVVNEKSGDLSNALKDERLSRQFKDSLSQQSMRDKVAELQVLFDTQEKEKELLKEKANNEAIKTRFYATIGIAVALALLLFIVWQRQKLKLKRKELETLNRLNNERNRIARDLHDNLGAELTIVTSKLDTKIFKTEIQTEREELEQISKQTRNASIVLRETVWSIKSEKLTVSSLRYKIEEFYNRLENPNIFSLNFQMSNEDVELGPLLALNLFRIAQEALTNILKYAEAKDVSIDISNKILKISDDGKGFDIENVKKGYGLNNMESRAREMNASYSISSSETGTEIKVMF